MCAVSAIFFQLFQWSSFLLLMISILIQKQEISDQGSLPAETQPVIELLFLKLPFKEKNYL
jgi:hypothetical protein